MIRRLFAFCSIVALLLAQGCGNKGPLYLPQDGAQQQQKTGSEQQE